MKKFEELTEREVLALAIALEEEDERVYADFAEGLRQDYPATASMFLGMREEESRHRRRLLELYQKKFGNYIPNGLIEVLNWRADASAAIPWPDVLRLPHPSGSASARRSRPVYFAELGGFHQTPVYRNPVLAVRKTDQGPVLIEQAGSTIVIGPGDRFEVDKLGNVLIAVATRQ